MTSSHVYKSIGRGLHDCTVFWSVHLLTLNCSCRGGAQMEQGKPGAIYGKPEDAQQQQQQQGQAPQDKAGPRDLWAAGLFVAHLVVIMWLAFGYGLDSVEGNSSGGAG
jgi:hypothetical protein